MWGRKKNFNPTRVIVAKSNNLLSDEQIANTTTYRPIGWLGPTLHVKGEITGSDDLLIDGSVEGTIRLDRKSLTLGAAAKVKADITVRDVVVFGHVRGNVCASRTIQIKKYGSVIGNLTAAELMIEQGAEFKGSLEIDVGETTNKSEAEDAPLATSSVAADLTASDNSRTSWN